MLLLDGEELPWHQRLSRAGLLHGDVLQLQLRDDDAAAGSVVAAGSTRGTGHCSS